MSVEIFKPEQGYIIAETACGHEGDLKRLMQLIEGAAEAGADAIKFQVFIPTERVTPGHPERALFHRLALTAADWQQAFQRARQKKLTIFSDVFGEESFALAKQLGTDGYKIHSEDLLNTFFIEKVARENKILMIGVGGAHRIEIYSLLNHLAQHQLLNQCVLMTGVQTFPTPIQAHAVAEVGDLVKRYAHFGVKIGFSDHVEGDCAAVHVLPLMALSQGAVMIEKHVTVDRAQQWEDYQSALGKKDFREFVTLVKTLAPLLKSVTGLNDFEKHYRQTFKKSPVAKRNLKKDQVLQFNDIEFVKHAKHAVPLSGIDLVGKKTKISLQQGEVIRATNIQHKVGGIIVARCCSDRLPNKAIKCIQDRETIALLIERIKRCQHLDCVVLATSTDSSDDILEEIAQREGILTFRGSLENLSLRFYEAAKHYGITQIVRITGDDILRDEAMIDRAIVSHLNQSCDVTLMDNMPYGTASEVFSLKALAVIMQTVEVPAQTEYLEYYLQNDRYFSVNRIASDYVFNPSIRLTLDYMEDFKLFEKIFSHFYPKKKDFTLREVLDWLNQHTDIVDINCFKKVKFVKQDLNVVLEI